MACMVSPITGLQNQQGTGGFGGGGSADKGLGLLVGMRMGWGLPLKLLLILVVPAPEYFRNASCKCVSLGHNASLFMSQHLPPSQERRVTGDGKLLVGSNLPHPGGSEEKPSYPAFTCFPAVGRSSQATVHPLQHKTFPNQTRTRQP